MAVINVSGTGALMSALRIAKGGDTIVLADGAYGSLDLQGKWGGTNVGKFDAPVTITSATPDGAVFTTIKMTNVQNITFDNVTMTGGFSAGFSSNIGVTNSTGFGLSFRDVDGVTVSGNHVAGGVYTLNLFSVQNFTVTGNTFEHAKSDLIQISRNSHTGLIENNILRDPIVTDPSAHPDMIQIFGWDGMTPHDITIRANHLYDDPATGRAAAQGIFLSDPQAGGFRNILIEENLISVRNPNAIYIHGGQDNVVVRHNSLIAGPEVFKGGTIRLVGQNGYDNSGVTVEGNVAVGIIDETRSSTVRDNHLYGSHLNAPNVFVGTGANPGDFALLDPRSVNAAGATTILREAAAKIQVEVEVPLPEMAASAPAATIVLPPIAPIASLGSLNFSGNLNPNPAWKLQPIVHLAHEAAMEIDEGTIALSFKADVVSWRRGIISKDTAGLDHGLTARIEDGSLIVIFEDGDSAARVTHAGVKAGVEYDLQISFGDGMGRVYLDDTLVGEVATDMDWTQNGDRFTVGADNSPSMPGTISALRYAFDGIISDFAVYDHALSPQELDALVASQGGLLA